MMMNQEVKQDLEKCLVLIEDGKIDEPLVLVYDAVYKVGSKLNYRVKNDINKWYFDEDWERKHQKVLEALGKVRDSIGSRENIRFLMDYKLIQKKKMIQKMLNIKKKEHELGK